MSIPLCRIAFTEQETGYDLNVIGVTSKLGTVVAMYALYGMVPVGIIKWAISHDEFGDILYLWTDPRWRRRGVATMLYQVATEWATEAEVNVPIHSDHRTVDGDAWARAVGGDLPENRGVEGGAAEDDYGPPDLG